MPMRKRAGQGSCEDGPGENCWKAALFRCAGSALKLASARSWAERPLGDTPKSRAFHAVIHRLWITLWITTLMSCKHRICFQTL